jgi:hypothetical protein
MASVLKPEIASILNGFLTINILSPSQVSAIFNQLLIFRSSNINGPFSQLAAIPLPGGLTATFLDIDIGPDKYYKVQFFNSSTLVSSQFSELAQETGIFSEYSVPISTATYPPEIALSAQDREIVESIRVTLGDMGSIERDYFNSSDHQGASSCASQISGDCSTWELSEPRGWPRRVILNGATKSSLTDPQVLGYKFLTFTGIACITGTLDIFYNHFRFADREILLAYDRARNLLMSCSLTEEQITTEMRIMQAAILLLEGELRDMQSAGAVSIRDGETSYDNSFTIRSRTEDLSDLKKKLRDLIDCMVAQNSYKLEGVRID